MIGILDKEKSGEVVVVRVLMVVLNYPYNS